MAKYLDDAGLKYVIKKIKSLLASKQDLLTFDAAPKKESKNPVTSGGIYAALYETDDILDVYKRQVWNGIVQAAQFVWNGLVMIVQGVMSAITFIIQGAVAVITAYWTFIAPIYIAIWDAICSAVSLSLIHI